MSHFPGRYFHSLDDGRVQCDVCPRFCRLNDGQRGLCFVRQREGNGIVLTTYGRSSGFCLDPIEKKPLHHFYPGTSILSFGTAGCNLSCNFCQNWDISKSREMDTLAGRAEPEELAEACVRHGAKSVAFTYNDPVVFLEYAVDTAKACRARGIKTVAVTAGYVTPEAGAELFAHMDAANVDLKGFTEEFYFKETHGHLQPVLETLEYIAKKTDCWLEITTLLIPGRNDSPSEIEAECAFVRNHLGAHVPLHFTAFHPDYKMTDVPATPAETLTRARQIAKRAGLMNVYTGNVHDLEGSTTYCSGCGYRLIVRDWYDLLEYSITPEGTCPECGVTCAGHFDRSPGTWGRRRKPITIRRA